MNTEVFENFNNAVYDQMLEVLNEFADATCKYFKDNHDVDVEASELLKALEIPGANETKLPSSITSKAKKTSSKTKKDTKKGADKKKKKGGDGPKCLWKFKKDEDRKCQYQHHDCP